MTALLNLFNQPLAHRLGWALLHSLWQGALVAVLFALLRFALRRGTARARYLAGCVCLLLLAAAPVFTFWLLPPAPDLAPGSGGSLPVSAIVPASVASDDNPSTGNTESGVSWIIQAGAGFLERAIPLLVPAWLAGVAFLTGRLLQGCARVQSLKFRGTQPPDPVWIERLNELKRRLKVSRPVRLLKSALVEVPTVIGWLRPVILLPASTLAGLTPAQLEAILAHELAHIRRHDYLVNVFQNVVETLMFYHPAVWWISRNLREEREHCCDDLVVEVCGNRLVYARALATLEELRGESPQLAFAASGGSLLNRIRRLLGLPVESGHSTWRQAAGLALIGTGLVLALAGAALMLVPEGYQAVARIKVEYDTPHEIEASEGKLRFNYDVNAFQTELAIIHSPLVLKRVVEELHLCELYGQRYNGGNKLKEHEALEFLTGIIRVQAVRDTSLVDIRAFSVDRDEAASLANAVAEAYRHYRHQLTLDLMTTGIEALENRWEENAKKVQEAQNSVDEYRAKLRIYDPDPQSTTPTPTITADVLREYQRTLTTFRTAEAHQKAQLESLMKLERHQLRESIQTALETPDAALATLFNELDLAEQKLRSIELTQAPENPVYRNAKQSIEDLNAKIDRKLDGILSGLENRLQQTQASIVAISESFEKAKSNDLAMAELTRPYYAAKQQLAELLQFKTVLGMKIASQKTELVLPRNSSVLIVNRAAPNFAPVSPNRGRATALVIFGVLLGILGLMTLRGNRRPAVSLHPA